MDRHHYSSAYFGEGKREGYGSQIIVEALGSIDMSRSLADMGKSPLWVTAKAVKAERKGGPQAIHLLSDVAHFIQLANAWKQSWFLETKKVYAYEEGEHTGGAPIMSIGGG